ncbi:hypothetical protein ONZ43_g839 [Nemania bipapillata]|uniref:Uncharacterized protein n=1 Tax=Nemania bipapillata TaxID=110536 RepID=A0ACC2J6L8_9PEZI|nr:hypothetical protein ONZ43_g839 [Nemania bipapillata]
MAAQNELRLDEMQWHHLPAAQQMQGIHTNSVLFYFAESPFFDKTSNNAVLANQAIYNPNMFHLIQTREAFEGRLKEMSGLEFIVAQEPAETAPGTGTGVWVIRKQTRKKREPEDEITVHAAYYLTATTSALNQCFPAADEARIWSPSRGHVYKAAQTNPNSRPRNTIESKETTPKPDGRTAPNRSAPDAKRPDPILSTFDLVRHAEHSMMIHMQSGGDYEDENPITGKPGAFNLSKTGRTANLQVPGITALNTTFKSTSIRDLGGKKTRDGNAKSGEKTPKTPTSGVSKPKRKKSKTGQTPTSL